MKKVRSKADGDREKEPPTPRKSVVNKSVIRVLKKLPRSFENSSLYFENAIDIIKGNF